MDDCIAVSSQRSNDNVELLAHELQGHSATGTRTRVVRVRAEYPSQLDYFGGTKVFDHRAITMHANDNAEHHPDNPKCPNAE